MNRTVRISLLLLLGTVAMLVWLKPASSPTPATVRISLPAQPTVNGIKPENIDALWRVITRRVVSKAAIYSLTKRLQSMNLEAVTIRNKEDVTMHAFDDVVLYKTRAEAWKASKFWRDHGIAVSVIEAKKDVHMIGLGRFYQGNYAEGMQKQLSTIGKEFRYQQRSVPIPTWRFTFAPMTKKDAENLWKRLNDSGVMMPIQMPERRFQELYGSSVSGEE